jgi:hypothetical protein
LSRPRLADISMKLLVSIFGASNSG